MSPAVRRMGGTSRPTWVEIDLDAITHNFRAIKNRLAPAANILAVVKANAYGHGMVEVSRRLVKEGVSYLGVASVDEAVVLREAKIKAPILILSSILPKEVKYAINYNLTFTVCDEILASELDKIARKANRKVLAHLKVDTGMGRLGIWHGEAKGLFEDILGLKNIILEGVYTHFATADEENTSYTVEQINNFKSLIKELEAKGFKIPYIHAANSAGTILFKNSHFSMVRPGLMIYGLYPNESISKILQLKPALSLKSRIIFLKRTPVGRSISYGATYTTDKDTLIATLPIGYADGLNRGLSNKGEVIVRKRRSPIVGRICMDHTMADVGHVDKVELGDEVVLIGTQGTERITAEEIARILGTIPYEVVCWISARVPRVYL